MRGSSQKVRLWEGKTTFRISRYDEDVLPDVFQKLRRWPISYPYPRNDRIDDRKRPRTFRALFMENEYLRVTVLPELGGHVYSAYDKLNGREVFYRMSELKPKPLGRRGAWGPVGIEFNFPTSHSPTTLSRVDAALRRNPDGSGSIVISDIERVSRMRWSIEISLRPGVNALEAVVTLHNRTALPHSYYYWANAAIPVDENTRFVLPFESTHGHGLPGKGSTWPVRNGVDLSWRRNIKHTMGVFGHGCREDFFGAYNVVQDCGVVHVADYRVLPGKKMFDWGTGPQGVRKGNEFSTKDGAYAELQAGLFEHQPSYEVLEPHTIVGFREIWLPLHGMGVPFSRANESGAVALDMENGKELRVAVNVTRLRRRCRVLLKRNGREVFDTVRDISPEEPLNTTVTLAPKLLKDADLELAVTCPQDGLLISHRLPGRGEPERTSAGWLDRKSHPDEQSGDRFGGESDGVLERLYLKGVRLEKTGLAHYALAAYEQVLEQDPGFARANLRMGVLSLWSGQWQKAIDHLNRALARNPDLAEAQYYLGLAYAGLGEEDRAKDAFWVALRSQVGDVRCLMELGRLAMRQKESAESAGLFERVLAVSPDDTCAVGLLSASLRHIGRAREALRHLQRTLSRFPTNYLLRSEMRILTGELDRKSRAKRADKQFKELMGRNAEAYLELAVDYAGAGLLEEALDVLKQGISATRSGRYVQPMLYYYAGAFLEKLGRLGEARRYFRRGGRIKSEFCFPGRVEAIAVLERTLELFPGDAKAAQYLGNILYHRARPREALDCWHRAYAGMRDCAVLCASIAVGMWESDQPDKAIHWLRRALRVEPDDVRLALWLVQAMAEAGGKERERLKLLAELFKRHPERDGVREDYAHLLLDRGKVEKALEVISTHRFRTRHGIFTLTQLHLNAHTTLGERCLTRKNYGKALEHFEQAHQIPLGLGEDETRFHFYGKAHYLAGVCLEKMGRQAEARKSFQKCVAEGRHWLPELFYYDHLSYKRLGKRRAAQAALDRLRTAVEQMAKSHRARPAYVHYLRSLYLRALGRRGQAEKEARLARRAGWRPSQELHFRYRFGFS